MKILAAFHPTPFCNLDCSYCWAPNRTVRSKMPLSTFELALDQIWRNREMNGLEVLWLTGEPLVMGIDYFREAVDVCYRKAPAGSRPTFVVQTNGTLIDENWCKFFIEHNFVVGVSIDGPQEIHDAHRKTRLGTGTFVEVERGVSLLTNWGVRGGAICVITKETLNFPADDLFYFFHSKGIAWSYLIEASIGDNLNSPRALAIEDLPKIEAYLSRLLDLWAKYPESYVRVFDQTARRAFGGILPRFDFNNLGCLDILNVIDNGDFFWGNPELMTATLGPLKHLRKNILREDIWDFRSSPDFLSYQNNVYQGVSVCRETCAFFDGCQGGNPAHKYYELGTFSTADHVSCRLNEQVVGALMPWKMGSRL